MPTTSSAKPLELTVSNFGPIAEASIELRPMSVFVGPSNTGKSYMAALVYALHRFFNWYSVNTNYNSAHGTRSLVEKFGMTRMREMLWELETAPSIKLQEPVATLVRQSLNDVVQLGKILDSEITRCFGTDKAKNLIRYSSSGRTGFSLHGNASTETGRNDPFEYNATVKRGTKLNASIPSTMPMRIEMENIAFPTVNWMFSLEGQMKGATEDTEERVMAGFIKTFASACIPSLLGPLARPAHYLPADRAGVMHAHQVAVRGLIASASRTGLRRDSPMPVLSGVLGDFMEQLVALAGSPQRAHDDYDNLAQSLEQTLMRGAVRVEQSPIDYPSFAFRPNGWRRDLPLMNASSMVSELAPVVLYLRHVVQPGDLLIIEEPESHLHPAMQVEFTRQLAAAVQSGIRIIITTHSEWVLEELANLVRLAELPEERREGIDDADTVLSSDQLGAWFFEPSSEGSGSVVREISLDTESATFPAGFGLVSESLYNRWAEISARIQER